MATICSASKKLFFNCLASFDQAAFGYTQGYTQSEQCLLALNELPPDFLGGPQSNAPSCSISVMARELVYWVCGC